jgi:hypothetical protein
VDSSSRARRRGELRQRLVRNRAVAAGADDGEVARLAGDDAHHLRGTRLAGGRQGEGATRELLRPAFAGVGRREVVGLAGVDLVDGQRAAALVDESHRVTPLRAARVVRSYPPGHRVVYKGLEGRLILRRRRPQSGGWDVSRPRPRAALPRPADRSLPEDLPTQPAAP